MVFFFSVTIEIMTIADVEGVTHCHTEQRQWNVSDTEEGLETHQ